MPAVVAPSVVEAARPVFSGAGLGPDWAKRTKGMWSRGEERTSNDPTAPEQATSHALTVSDFICVAH